MVLFPNISMATMTTFPGTSLIIKKINWIEQMRKISFDTMSSPNKCFTHSQENTVTETIFDVKETSRKTPFKFQT